MSVYTSLSRGQIENFLQPYSLASLTHYTGISAGIENTNYLLKLGQHDCVLTIYEHFSEQEVSIYLDLLVQLSRYERYYPCPLMAPQGYVQRLENKPAALFNCLSGESITEPSIPQIQALAGALARFHNISPLLSFNQANTKGVDWLGTAFARVAGHLSVDDLALAQSELAYQQNQSTQHLARGVIHADLFKDNVLFVGEQLTGMLDFYAACYDCFLLDIAISLNDWCVNAQGVFERDKQVVFMQAYQQTRAVSALEEKYLALFLRRACLRFWLSRLEHSLFPRVGEITQDKDPNLFKQLLVQHLQYYGAMS